MTSRSTRDGYWQAKAVCRGMDPDIWWSQDQKDRRLARHVCLVHCPVLAECRRNYAPRGGETAAGLTYTEKGEPVKNQPFPIPRCELCEP